MRGLCPGTARVNLVLPEGEPFGVRLAPEEVSLVRRDEVGRVVNVDGRRRRRQRLHVFDELPLLLARQAEVEEAVVVVDHVEQSREASVVVEAALLVRPQPVERSRSVTLVGRAHGLELVYSYFGPRVHVPARLCEERRRVAGGAPGLVTEKLLALLRGHLVEAAHGRRGRVYGELVGVQRG